MISGANGFLGKYFIKTLIRMNQSLSKKIKVVAIDIKFDKIAIHNFWFSCSKKMYGNNRKIKTKTDYC